MSTCKAMVRWRRPAWLLAARRVSISPLTTALITHKVVWKFGSYSATQSIAAGATYASYTIPLSWLSAIPNATSGAATATLETIDTTRGFPRVVQLWISRSLSPASVVPTISSVSAAPVNDNSVISGWGIYVYGEKQGQGCPSTALLGRMARRSKATTPLPRPPNVGSSSASSFNHRLSLRHQRCDRHRQGNGLPRQNGDQNHHVFRSIIMPRRISTALKATAATAPEPAMT